VAAEERPAVTSLTGEPADAAVRGLLGTQVDAGRAPIVEAFAKFVQDNPGNPDNVFLEYRTALLYSWYSNPATDEKPDRAKAVAVFETIFEKYDNGRPVVIDAKLRCAELLRSRRPPADLDRAEELARQVLSDAQRLEEPFGRDCFVLRARLEMGSIAAARGDIAQARAFFEKVLDYRDLPPFASPYFTSIYYTRISSAIRLIRLGDRMEPDARLAYLKEISPVLPRGDDFVRIALDHARGDARGMGKRTEKNPEAGAVKDTDPARGLAAPEPGGRMASEMLPVLFRVKSADAAERQHAVTELMGIREAVSEALRGVVADANSGALSNDSKASALFLMGRLGLWQCKDILEAEKDWHWDTNPPPRTTSPGRRYYREKGPTPGGTALFLAALGDNVTVKGGRQSADLSSYRFLGKALDDLRVDNPDTLREAEDALLEWYRVVGDGLVNIIESGEQPAHAPGVRATAIWLLGEYRVPRSQLALEIEARDEDGVTSAYPAVLEVADIEPSHYVAHALVKCGRKVKASTYVHKLPSATLTGSGRELLAQALSLIDAEAAAKAYDECVSLVETSSGDRAGDLARLRSVEGIIKGSGASP
jgi:hypothetical protein